MSNSPLDSPSPSGGKREQVQHHVAPSANGDGKTTIRKSHPPANDKPKSAIRKRQGEDIGAKLAALKAEFNRHYYFSDTDVIDLVLGAVAGNHLESDPLWLHLISPPSGGKTELLMSTFDCVETYFLSDVTAASLISGYQDPPADKKPSKKIKNDN